MPRFQPTHTTRSLMASVPGLAAGYQAVSGILLPCLEPTLRQDSALMPTRCHILRHSLIANDLRFPSSETDKFAYRYV